MDPAGSLPPPTAAQIHYPESTNSPPRSRHNAAETWDEPLAAVPGAKLRLMCSYGGHIIPRPHDKSLCYVGGDTRIVVVDRCSSQAELHSRLSHALLNGRHFSLKYQLPNEELDSLISVSTDEDLENMIEEYDRTNSNSCSPLRPSRLRLFLFLSRPETAASMGCLLADAKSESWFVDALNNSDLLSRGLSDSAAEANNILELDQIPKTDDSCNELENHNNKNPIKNDSVIQDFHYPDSPVVVDTITSSFESSVSSPSMANLPPIKVRVEGGNNNNAHTLDDEQFSHINVHKQDDVLIVANAAPLLPAAIGGTNYAAAQGEIIRSDDEKSDHGGAPSGIRKPPLPLQLGPRKIGDGYGLTSPDSVASDSSIASAASFSKQMTNQEAITQAIAPPQQNQQQAQFIQANAHYLQHPTAGAVPISSYYPMYAPPSQQQMDQQYSMYLLPITQAQTYNFANAASSRPPNATIVPATYKEALPPIYPTKPISQSKAETAASVYTTPTTLVQVPSNQFQQQYFGLSQVPPPPSASSTATPNYGYDYSHPRGPTHEQVYYAQHPVPSQYQTMTPATAVLLSQASSQLAAENAKTSQPL